MIVSIVSYCFLFCNFVIVMYCVGEASCTGLEAFVLPFPMDKLDNTE